MRTPAETWIELIQRQIEEGRASGLDSYVLALHIYADVMVKALQEKQDEFDALSFSPRDVTPN